MPSRIGRPLEAPNAASPLGEGRWSVPLGRYGGVTLRMHVSLAVGVAFVLAYCVQSGSGIGWLTLAVYLFSLAMHEAAHGVAISARRRFYLGTDRPAVLLGPFGGITEAESPEDPRDRVFIAMAGPVANLALVVLGICCLSMSGALSSGRLLLNPVHALELADKAASPTAILSAVLVVVNWPLFWLNLAPAAPFDGGVALKAWLGVWLGRDTANEAARKIALLLSAGLLGVGFTLALVAVTSPIVPAVLTSLAVLIAFGSRSQGGWHTELKPLGLRLKDTGGRSLTDLPALPSAPIRRGREEDWDEGAGLDDSEPRWDDSRVDEVLAKIHKRGVQELTANERAILERASQIYRRRRED